MSRAARGRPRYLLVRAPPQLLNRPVEARLGLEVERGRELPNRLVSTFVDVEIGHPFAGSPQTDPPTVREMRATTPLPAPPGPPAGRQRPGVALSFGNVTALVQAPPG